ncbi:MAG: phage major capsid protein [Candidatus Atribacteria bacterium]|nr:phage major capsid protein [Candidatus Atribacteria bacterium]
MPKMKELQEERGKLAQEIKTLNDAHPKGTDWTAEDEKRWADINKAYDDAELACQREARADEVAKGILETEERQAPEVDSGRSAVATITEEDRSAALLGWARAAVDRDVTDEQKKAMTKCAFGRAAYNDLQLERDYRKIRAEARAMSTSATAGGDTIPAGFIPNFEIALLAYGGVREAATIIRTATGNALPWPTSNDTSNKGVLLAENSADTEVTITTSAITLNAFKMSSRVVLVSSELLEDSAFNLTSYIGDACGIRIGRICADYYTTGTGSTQPKGIVTAATLGVTAASATAITFDELYDLEHSVDPAYRVGPGTGWMMHDTVLKAVRKLKNTTTNEYLWQPNVQLGVPQTLLNYPVTVNQSMASSIAASAKTLLFGKLSKFLIRDVASLRLKVLTERYAEYDQVGFIAFFRTDSDLLDAGTHPVKYLIQASGAGTGS